MMLEQYLQNIGLNNKEAKLYLTSLQIGPAFVHQLAKISGLKRSTVYQVIDSLLDKSLFSISQKGKRKIYTATDPESLSSFVKQRENILSQIMPELMALKNISANKPSISIYEGQKGLEWIYEDMIKMPGEILAFAAPSEKIAKNLLNYLHSHWRQRRYKQKNFLRRININETNDPTNNFKKISEPEKLEQIYYLPKENYPFSIGIYIYRQKVAFVSYQEQEMFGIIVTSPEINVTMKMMFETFWNR